MDRSIDEKSGFDFLFPLTNGLDFFLGTSLAKGVRMIVARDMTAFFPHPTERR